MTKKRLKLPGLPPGSRLEFFRELQAVVRQYGDPPTVEIGHRTGYSHQAVYKALTGPKMPSRRIAHAIANALGGLDAVDPIMVLWDQGAEEERLIAEGASTSPVTVGPEVAADRADVIVPSGSPPLERRHPGRPAVPVPGGSALAVVLPAHEQYVRPALTQREIQVLRAWIMSDSKVDAAQNLMLSIGSVNTYLTRIRSKYQQVGRDAPTKASLLVRALQDGIVRSDEF